MWQVGTAGELAEVPACDWQGLSCGSWEHQEAAAVSARLAGREAHASGPGNCGNNLAGAAVSNSNQASTLL